MIEIPTFVIIILGLAFVIYLLLDLSFGLTAIFDILKAGIRRIKTKKEPSDTDRTKDVSELEKVVGKEGEILEELNPYGKIKIGDEIYDAMNIGDRIASGKVVVIKRGETCLMVRGR